MTDQELREELKKAFDLFDKDADGIIDMDDFSKLVTFLGLDEEKLDTTSFLVNPDEMKCDIFLQVMMTKLSSTAEEVTSREVVSAFKHLDLDDTGLITNRNLGKLLRDLHPDTEPLTEEEITALIKEFDVVGKGELNYEDLYDAMKYRMEKLQLKADEDEEKELEEEKDV